MKIHTLALGTAVMLLSGCAYGTQLLQNPDFESGLFAPWTNDTSVQTGSWTMTGTNCHGGSYCVTDVGDVGLEQLFGFGANTSLITSASFWVNPTNSVLIALLYQVGGPDYFVFNPTALQKGAWDQINLMPDLRANASLIGIDVFGFSGSATTLDDFSILGTVPEPGAFWLLAAGIGTLGTMARWKKKARNRS